MPVASKLDPVWQDHLDFLLPSREFLRPDQVAASLNIDPRSVDHLFSPNGLKACPDLTGFEFVARGTGQRPHKRIRRDSVILLVANGANYTPDEWRVRLVEVISKLPVRDLVLMQGAIHELIRRKQS